MSIDIRLIQELRLGKEMDFRVMTYEVMSILAVVLFPWLYREKTIKFFEQHYVPDQPGPDAFTGLLNFIYQHRLEELVLFDYTKSIMGEEGYEVSADPNFTLLLPSAPLRIHQNTLFVGAVTVKASDKKSHREILIMVEAEDMSLWYEMRTSALTWNSALIGFAGQLTNLAEMLTLSHDNIPIQET